MSLAVAGHGATIAMEKDGDPAGTFTVIAELNGDINEPGMMRPWSEVTPHQDTIDSGVTGRLGREAITFTVNFVYDDATHDHLTGLRKRIIDNDLFGLRFRGPGGGASDHEIILSGHMTNIQATYPVREGAITASCEFRASKAQIIDGVVIGTAV
jgi:hypothetical protein